MKSIEQQIFFKSKDCHLFAMIYRPEQKAEISPSEGFVLCHAFAEEQKSSQRIMVEIAQMLCRNGYYVFIFDASGCGDSEGELADATITAWLDDLKNAILFFKGATRIVKIGLIGLRFGGYLARIIAEQDQAIGKLILLEPVLDAKLYLHQALRQKLIQELHTDGQVTSQRKNLFDDLNKDHPIDFDGYEVTANFYNSLTTPVIDMKAFKFTGKLTLFQISLRPKPSKAYLEFIQKYQMKGNQVVYQLFNMPPFWSKIESPDASILIAEILKTIKG